MNARPTKQTAEKAAWRSGGRAVRVAGTGVAGRRQTARWPWPAPANSVVTVLEDRAVTAGLLTTLSKAGIAADSVWSLSSSAGAETPCAAYRGHGLLARAVSVINSGDELRVRIEQELAAGASALLVHAANSDTAHVACLIMGAGGRLPRRTGR